MNITDITPGMRVRLTADWRAALKAGGVSPGYIESRGRGVVTHIETSPFWDAISYQISDGMVHVASPDNLERDTSDDVTARIRRAV